MKRSISRRELTNTTVRSHTHKTCVHRRHHRLTVAAHDAAGQGRHDDDARRDERRHQQRVHQLGVVVRQDGLAPHHFPAARAAEAEGAPLQAICGEVGLCEALAFGVGS